jgi:hypothetical protein
VRIIGFESGGLAAKVFDFLCPHRYNPGRWMKIKNYNKREKLANLLFELVKYLLTVVGVGAVIPESPISFETAFSGIALATILLCFALVTTPEE